MACPRASSAYSLGVGLLMAAMWSFITEVVNPGYHAERGQIGFVVMFAALFFLILVFALPTSGCRGAALRRLPPSREGTEGRSAR
jgi:hypothetical protein